MVLIKKLVCYKATSSGLNGAGSSYVAEVGAELLKIAEDQGVIKKMAYGAAWVTVKVTRWVVWLFTDEYKGVNDDFFINVLVNGDPIYISDLWWPIRYWNAATNDIITFAWNN